ncbi:MAG TPA: aldo/keto reductase [Acidimicrobiales bacterium]|jgi:aryl-alcohol dehydrogenase-like predicted oxidoreductase
MIEVAGTRMSAIGLGCWQFGSREWGYGDWYAENEAGAIVGRALDLGVTLLDTAEIYGYGRSERIVGRAIAGRRDEAFVATKLFPILPLAPVVGWRGRGSARRLGVDAIDLYQVHQPNPVVPDSTVMAGMRRLQAEGIVRQVGVSNYSLRRWQTAERALAGPVLSNQVHYSLIHRPAEDELLPWANANDRLIIAYSPLEQGVLGGRYGPDNRPKGVRAMNRHFLPESLERSAPLLDAVRRTAAAHDATPAQVALAWLLAQGNVVAIPGASSVGQLEHNVAAADLDLTADEVEELSRLSDGYRPAGAAALARAMVSRR